MVANVSEVALTRPYDGPASKSGSIDPAVDKNSDVNPEGSKEALQLHWEKIVGHKFQIVVSSSMTNFIGT